MPRPRLADGELGKINTQLEDGVWRARAKYRTVAGQQRSVRGSGSTAEEAQEDLRRNFEAKIPVGAGLTRQATVVEIAWAWYENKKLTRGEKVRPQSFQQYEITVRKHITAAFGQRRWADLDVMQAQELLNAYRKVSTPATVNTMRSRLIEIGKYAVRMGLASSVMFDLTDTFDVEQKLPAHFKPAEIQSLRELFRDYRRPGDGQPGPRDDGQIAAICEIILGVSIRPGEVLALRRMDVDATVNPLVVDVNGTIVEETGRGKYRQDVPKNAKQRRTIAAPDYAAEAIRSRLAATAGQPPTAFLFQTRSGRPMSTHEFDKRLARFRDANKDFAGVDWEKFKAYTYRKTAAKAVREKLGLDQASSLLGHADSSTTQKHYAGPRREVSVETAEVLGELFGT